MARGRKAGGAKRGPKPKMTKEDGEALAKQLRSLKKLVRAIHADVVPGSTEGTPDPDEAPVEVAVLPGPVGADPATSLDGAAGVSVVTTQPQPTGVTTPDGTALRI